MFPNGEKINFKKSGVETKSQLIHIIKLKNSIVFTDGRNGQNKFINGEIHSGLIELTEKKIRKEKQ